MRIPQGEVGPTGEVSWDDRLDLDLPAEGGHLLRFRVMRLHSSQPSNGAVVPPLSSCNLLGPFNPLRPPLARFSALQGRCWTAPIQFCVE